MEKIETEVVFQIQSIGTSGIWHYFTSQEYRRKEQAQKDKRRFEKDYPEFKFRIVRATTTYEVMEETE